VYQKKECIIEGDMCILKDIIQQKKYIHLLIDYLVVSKKNLNISYWLIVVIKKNYETCNTGDMRQLTVNLLPYKKYIAVKIDNYHTKEISIIRI
jgi:hypothetical protein